MLGTTARGGAGGGGARAGHYPWSRKNWVFLLILLGLVVWFLLVWFDTAGLRSGGEEVRDEDGDGALVVDYSKVEIKDAEWPSGRKKVVLLTGGAGFIGSHTAEFLIARGDKVIIIDEVNDYYDVTIKEDNLRLLRSRDPTLDIYRLDICDRESVKAIFEKAKAEGAPITHICHLAARAGVRYSIENPDAYIHSNLQGTLVMLDMARDYKIANFVFASSSSVYGQNKKVPFAETDRVDDPVSPYAATKRGCELLAYTYNHLYGIPMAGLRFFTVYGPRGRPDMAPFKFIEAIYKGKPIDKFGDGTTSRDYTFVSDIVKGIVASIDRPFAKLQVFNLGNSRTVPLNRFIQVVEHAVKKKAAINHLPPQPGDVPITFADLRKSKQLLGYDPQVTIEEGIQRMATWYIEKYGKGQ